MRKLITFFITALLICSSSFAADIADGTKLYFTPNANWKQADARFAAYYFGTGGNAWVSLNAVTGETDLYLAVTPAGTWDNVIFCRMNPGTTQNNWDNKWNQTSDLVYDGINNRYTLEEGVWDKGSGTWSLYTPQSVETTVYLTAPTKVFIDESITLSAISDNVTDPVYVYSVKKPESADFVTTTSPYQPTEVGTYTFKVEVAESTSPATILATDSKEVVVKQIPDPITIKVKKPTDWEQISFYNWNNDVAGNFIEPVIEGEWYTHTFTRMDGLNIIFVNGNDWDISEPTTEEEAKIKFGKQTVNIEDIISSTCYQIIEATYVEGDSDWGKRRVSEVPCSPPTNFETTEISNIISIKDNSVQVSFDGQAQINLYNVNGQLIHSENAISSFAKQLQNGIYILCINDKTHKLIIQ